MVNALIIFSLCDIVYIFIHKKKGLAIASPYLILYFYKISEGHCDNTGTDEINDPLSENRALSVQTYLTKKGKVDAAKIMVVGFGSKQPIADNKTAKGRNANRRVELKLNY